MHRIEQNKENKKKRKALEEENPVEASKREKLMKDFAQRSMAESLQDSLDMDLAARSLTIRNRLRGQKLNVDPEWYRVDATDEDVEKARSLPGFSTPASLVGLYKDGLYRSPVYKGMDIYLKDGVAKILGGENYTFAEKVMALFDFYAVGQGTNSFVFDFDKPEYFDQKQLEEVIAMAAQRGYTIELGPNIQQFLLTDVVSWSDDYVSGYTRQKKMSGEDAQKRRTDIPQLVAAANEEAAKIQEEKGIKEKADHYRYKLYTDAITGEDKIDKKDAVKDVDNEAHRKEVTEAAYNRDKDPKKHATTKEQQIKVATTEIKDIHDRLNQLDIARTSLDNDLATWKKRFQDADALPEPKKTEKRIELIEKYEKADKERSALMSAIEVEHTDLIKRRQFWAKEVGDLEKKIEARAEDAPKSAFEKLVGQAKTQLGKTEKRSQELGETKMVPTSDTDPTLVAAEEPDTAIGKVRTNLTNMNRTYTDAKNNADVQKAQQARSLQA